MNPFCLFPVPAICTKGILGVMNTLFFFSMSFLAQVPSFTSSNADFSGITGLAAKIFWLLMFLAFIVGVCTAMFSMFQFFQRQEVPFMLLVVTGCFLGIPAFSFLIANALGLAPALNPFNTSNGMQ